MTGNGQTSVLIVLNSLQPSGAETMWRAAGAEWARQNIHVRILALAPNPGPFAAELRRAGYRVTNVWSDSPTKLVLKFRAELRRSPVDVVHLHAERGNFWLAVAARSAGCAVVRTIHSVFEFSGRLRAERIAQRAILGLLGIEMVGVSASVQANEKRRFGNRIIVIGNWFDPVRFTRRTQLDRSGARAELLGDWASEASFVVVTVGNCSTVKNHALLVRALAKVGDSVPWVWLHLGRGDTEPRERALVDRFRMAHRVLFLGYSDTSAGVLAAADAYVMTSEREGIGIAAIEAMARGVPVILTDVPGLRDLGAESDAVRMVTENPTELASAIREVYAQPHAVREKIGLTLAHVVRSRHSLVDGVAAYTEVYRRAATRRRLPSRG